MSPEKPEETATQRIARELTEALVANERSLGGRGENLPPAEDDPTPGGLWQAPATPPKAVDTSTDDQPSDPGSS